MNLLIWNEESIKPSIGALPCMDSQYLTNLLKPISNEKVRLNYSSTSGAMPHLTTWLNISDEERKNLLMRRLRRIKSNFK